MFCDVAIAFKGEKLIWLKDGRVSENVSWLLSV